MAFGFKYRKIPGSVISACMFFVLSRKVSHAEGRATISSEDSATSEDSISRLEQQERINLCTGVS